jgi:HTH-type transcriptional regulator, transcriptional repressor of NAD biosynthesis genes
MALRQRGARTPRAHRRMTFQHALIVGKFAPPHRGHQHLIEAALAQAQRVTVLCYAVPDFVAMPSERRARWLRELYPAIEVYVPQAAPPDDAGDEAQQTFVRDWLAAHGIAVDAVFTSEPYGDTLARRLGADVVHCEVDLARGRIPIHASAIRIDVHAHRQWLHPSVYRHFVRRVVFLGAESTGKSTLTDAMAQRYGTTSVPEIGRVVWEEKRGRLLPGDYIDIAARHRAAEDAALLEANRFVFVDTNAVTTLLLGFCYRQLDTAPPELSAWADACKERYAYTFVCDDDIAFEQDGWRDDGSWRARVQGMVLYDLAVRGIEYRVVRGALAERIEAVAQVLDADRQDLTRRDSRA